MISKLNIIELSDVHLGHRTTETEHIIENLLLLLPDVPSMSEVDMIIIAGDLFDRLLNLSAYDVYVIHKWIYGLLSLCKKHDIVLRVLEGTPGHDNGQNLLIPEINEQSGIGCDVVYFNTLDIEFIPKFDIHVLYIPDEYHPEAAQTLAEVRLLMAERNLAKVDFAVMHGQFDYQIPPNLLNRIPHHDSKAYLELVKYIIFIGHIHQHSQYERILVAGSTDRLQHGEEEDKGIIKATVYENGDFEAEFVVNKGAKQYRTLDVSSQELSQALDYIKSIVEYVPDGSYLRIRANQDDSIVNSLRELRTTYPQITWTVQTEKAVSSKLDKPVRPEVIMDNLHRNTIPTLMEKRVSGKYDNATTSEIVETLKGIINETSDNTATPAK